MGFILKVPEELLDWVDRGPIPQEIVDRNINEFHVDIKPLTMYCDQNICQFMSDIHVDAFRQYLIKKGIDEVIRVFMLEELSSISFFNVIRLHEYDDSIVKMTFYVSSGGMDIFTIDDMNIKSYTNSRLLNIYGIDCSNVISELLNTDILDMLNTALLIHLDDENIDPIFTASLGPKHIYSLMLLSGTYSIGFDVYYIRKFIKDKELIENQFISEFVLTCLEEIYISSIPLNTILYKMIICAAKAYRHRYPERTTVDHALGNRIRSRFIRATWTNITKMYCIDGNNVKYIDTCMNNLQLGFFGAGGIIVNNESSFDINMRTTVETVQDLIYFCDGDVDVASNAIDTVFSDMEIFRPLTDDKNIIQKYIDLYNDSYRNDSDSCIKLYVDRVMNQKMYNMSYEDRYNKIKDKLDEIKDPTLRSTLNSKYDLNNMIPIFDLAINLQ